MDKNQELKRKLKLLDIELSNISDVNNNEGKINNSNFNDSLSRKKISLNDLRNSVIGIKNQDKVTGKTVIPKNNSNSLSMKK